MTVLFQYYRVERPELVLVTPRSTLNFELYNDDK